MNVKLHYFFLNVGAILKNVGAILTGANLQWGDLTRYPIIIYWIGQYEEERLGNSVLLCQSLSHDHVKFPPSFQVFINKKNQSNIDVLPTLT